MIRCELSRPPTGFRSYQAPADHVAAVLLPSADTVKGIRAFLDGAGEPQRSLSSPLAGQHRAALCHPQREALPERCDSIIRDVSPISDRRFYANETSRRPRQFTKNRACRVADVTCDEMSVRGTDIANLSNVRFAPIAVIQRFFDQIRFSFECNRATNAT